MAKSLRDQLVASGLASANQAKKAEKQVRAEAQVRKKKSKDANKQGKAQNAESEATRRARQVQAEKSQQNRELAKTRNSKAAERALRAEIKQIVAQHDQREAGSREDDVAYNFLHKHKVKRIYIPAAQVDQLSRGQLVIINNDGLYHLVTKEIADKIAERDGRWIVTAHDGANTTAEEESDDFYKDFKVPDDLDW